MAIKDDLKQVDFSVFTRTISFTNMDTETGARSLETFKKELMAHYPFAEGWKIEHISSAPNTEGLMYNILLIRYA